MSRKAINRALVADALSDEEPMDDPDAPTPGDEPEPTIPTRVEAAPAPVAQVAGLTLTPEVLKELLLGVVQAAQGGNAALAEAVQESVARARQKMPEVESHSGVSTLNPQGGPKPAVRLPVWHGLIDPQDNKIHPLVPIAGVNSLEAMCSVREIEALNALRPTHGLVPYELTDGSTAMVQIIEQKDGAGAPHRLVICWPQGFFSDKFKRNTIGTVTKMCAQLAPPVAA